MRSLVFCTTCRYSPEDQVGPQGLTGGETLARHMEAVLAERGRADVAVERQACLWNCMRPCSVILRDTERFTYVTGSHVPEKGQAEAILTWFDLHGESATGEVPFRTWPQAMRGHFIARVPPVKP
jgi:predicted metal-binding protein